MIRTAVVIKIGTAMIVGTPSRLRLELLDRQMQSLPI
jgi:hypothetical protein